MHEYGLMEDVVQGALEACPSHADRVVVQVRVRVGEFAFASRESLATAFEVLTRGTPLEGAHLEVQEVPGRAACEACGFEGSAAEIGPELSEPPVLLLCPRCGFPLLVTSGDGVAFTGVQLQDCGNPGPNPGHGGQ